MRDWSSDEEDMAGSTATIRFYDGNSFLSKVADVENVRGGGTKHHKADMEGARVSRRARQQLPRI